MEASLRSATDCPDEALHWHDKLNNHNSKALLDFIIIVIVIVVVITTEVCDGCHSHTVNGERRLALLDRVNPQESVGPAATLTSFSESSNLLYKYSSTEAHTGTTTWVLYSNLPPRLGRKSAARAFEGWAYPWQGWAYPCEGWAYPCEGWAYSVQYCT
jgi:hypothetical protein